MKAKWNWWIADIICLCLVILSFLHKDKNAHCSVDSPVKPSSIEAVSGDISTSPHPTDAGSEVLAQEQVGDTGFPDNARHGSAHANETSTRDEQDIFVRRVFAPAVNDQANRNPFTLDEITNRLRDKDLRAALYCARDLLSDSPTREIPEPYFVMGLVLYRTCNFPECISMFEHVLDLNARSHGRREFAFLANIHLSRAYYRIGKDEKARQCLDEAYNNARSRRDFEVVDEARKRLEAG
jgi:tetratricopeptide (TPR) repeat protein